ncbi:hypothetical protein B1757_02920 [Acidithiobacillus marinus]|uniref:Uncharacterized protein n=1 Tax=Acidithiobacillus marinus TaxID=187490 RepID=A0A2I1DPH2_9PROT|nr:hypothetical protein [Acidithiobacillus marinus]PKY11760.1 hypothetical protein B1757_02920 [Acidithiobacillus marinus]
MKVLVSLSGGLVNAVYLDDEAQKAGLQAVIADYDCEGSDVIPVQDPDGDDVLLWRETPIVESSFAQQMFQIEEVLR